MNYITDEMLPELPEEMGAVRCMIRGEMDYSEAGDYYYTRQQMRDYARAAISDLRAELAAKSKDAARYRFLRSQMKIGSVRTALPLYKVPYMYLHEECQSESGIEDAIDAAMGEGNGR